MIPLDKGVVRRVYEARARLVLGRPPTPFQTEAANVWAHLRALNTQLNITEQTEHILQRRSPLFATALLAQARALKKGRYLRRWARRLREVGFSPEDAIVIAYGSFGLDLLSQRVGIEAVVTNDLKLRVNFCFASSGDRAFSGVEGSFLILVYPTSVPAEDSSPTA